MHFNRLDVIGRFGFGHDFSGGTSGDAKKIMGAWRKMAIMGMSPKGFVVRLSVICTIYEA